MRAKRNQTERFELPNAGLVIDSLLRVHKPEAHLAQEISL
jgi:hypothetical protein